MRKDDNFTHSYINKRLNNGVELIAATEHLSKKDTVKLLLTRCLSSYMGEMISQYIESGGVEPAIEKAKRARFMRLLKQYSRSQGMAVDKKF